MAEPHALSRQFDDAALLDDEVWPRDPEAMVEPIVAFAALPAHGRLLTVLVRGILEVVTDLL